MLTELLFAESSREIQTDLEPKISKGLTFLGRFLTDTVVTVCGLLLLLLLLLLSIT